MSSQKGLERSKKMRKNKSFLIGILCLLISSVSFSETREIEEPSALEAVRENSLASLKRLSTDKDQPEFFRMSAGSLRSFLMLEATKERFSALTEDQQVFLLKLLPMYVTMLGNTEAQARLVETFETYQKYASYIIDLEQPSADSAYVAFQLTIEDLPNEDQELLSCFFIINKESGEGIVQQFASGNIEIEEITFHLEPVDNIKIRIEVDGEFFAFLEIVPDDPDARANWLFSTRAKYVFSVFDIVEDGELGWTEIPSALEAWWEVGCVNGECETILFDNE